ncbi:MAG TPA: diacylglycerol kinase family protein [Candidatus Dormibacteraeota bacterium]|nr:diacylglycerol kinase family protein [Candidatus Dormibacteraeota bacterium]
MPSTRPTVDSASGAKDRTRVNDHFYAIINPAAGGGRCGKLSPAAVDRLRLKGLGIETAQTSQPGEATALARNAYARGVRNFLAVGGDGTAFEIINGLFPEALTGGKPVLGFLPLGTGNSFLRDFTTRGVEHTIEALAAGVRRPCDVIRLRHSDGDIYFLNLLSLGFPADVGALTNRRFKSLGEFGYILGVLTQLLTLRHSAFAHRLDAAIDWDRRECLFLTFSNSKFTGGKMMIAPHADPSDAKIEYVRWSPIGRLKLLWLFPQLFSGKHIQHRLASRAAAERIELDLSGPVNVMVDGEILTLQCRSLEILPAALDVVA